MHHYMIIKSTKKEKKPKVSCQIVRKAYIQSAAHHINGINRVTDQPLAVTWSVTTLMKTTLYHTKCLIFLTSPIPYPEWKSNQGKKSMHLTIWMPLQPMGRHKITLANLKTIILPNKYFWDIVTISYKNYTSYLGAINSRAKLFMVIRISSYRDM